MGKMSGRIETAEGKEVTRKNSSAGSDGWVTVRQAQLQLANYGIHKTLNGIRYMVRSYQFGSSYARWIQSGKYKIAVAELIRYIATMKAPIPDDWIKVTDAVKLFGVKKSSIYHWIKLGILHTQYFGSGEGILYVSKEEIRSIAEKHTG
jgi:hypothetical protein